MPTTFRKVMLLPWALLALTACAAPQAKVHPNLTDQPTAGQAPVQRGEAQVAEGRIYRFKFSSGSGVPDPALAQVTAQLEPGGKVLVITLPGAPAWRLPFKSRDRSQWQGDCTTMDGSTLCEVADLVTEEAQPLILAGQTFSKPVVKVKCSPGRIVLSEGKPEGELSIVLDLEA
jgi:hypothetical protein